MSIKPFNDDDYCGHNAEINMTPLIDVMLVLVVIMLVTAPILEKSTHVDLPHDSGTVAHEDSGTTTISVTKDGEYLIESQKVAKDLIEQKLGELKTDEKIAIKADAKTDYENVVYLLGMLSRSGFTSVSFITLEKTK